MNQKFVIAFNLPSSIYLGTKKEKLDLIFFRMLKVKKKY